MLLTGGPTLRAVGRLAGLRIPAGAARHQVAVTEPHPAFDVERMPMVFDLGAGLYWRLEEGGLLFGMSNPDEPPGPARRSTGRTCAGCSGGSTGWCRRRRGLGLRKAWAATIDYTPDHLPIIGPAVPPDGDRDRRADRRLGRAARDDVGPGRGARRRRPGRSRDARRVDVRDLGLDRFDAAAGAGWRPTRSRLPFPVAAGD